ncbi:MAG: hypothetical protein ABIE23_05255 [archaeon]
MIRKRCPPKRLKRIERILKRDAHKMRTLGRKRVLIERLSGKKAEVWGYNSFLERYNNFHWMFMPLVKEETGTENFRRKSQRKRLEKHSYSFEMLQKEKGRLVSRTIKAMTRHYEPFGLKEKEFKKNAGPLLYELYLFLRSKGFTNRELIS